MAMGPLTCCMRCAEAALYNTQVLPTYHRVHHKEHQGAQWRSGTDGKAPWYAPRQLHSLRDASAMLNVPFESMKTQRETLDMCALRTVKSNSESCRFAGNNVTSNLKWDLGGRNVTAGLLKVLKFSQGRFLELGAQYSEKTQLLTLEAAGKPHKDHRLAAACVLAHRSYHSSCSVT